MTTASIIFPGMRMHSLNDAFQVSFQQISGLKFASNI